MSTNNEDFDPLDPEHLRMLSGKDEVPTLPPDLPDPAELLKAVREGDREEG